MEAALIIEIAYYCHFGQQSDIRRLRIWYPSLHKSWGVKDLVDVLSLSWLPKVTEEIDSPYSSDSQRQQCAAQAKYESTAAQKRPCQVVADSWVPWTSTRVHRHRAETWEYGFGWIPAMTQSFWLVCLWKVVILGLPRYSRWCVICPNCVRRRTPLRVWQRCHFPTIC